ncbi:MAG: hypothetical protein COV79_01130, partial [Parcubacteria group bacterium CG11_big_fil_rev_8_21_14_0_20_41_14]
QGKNPSSSVLLGDEASVSSKMVSQNAVPLRFIDHINRPVIGGIDSVLIYRGKFLVAATESEADSNGIVMANLTTLPGDFTGDGFVHFDDFFVFADNFGKNIQELEFSNKPMDLDGDGTIGFQDFFVFVDHFGLNMGTRAGKAIVLPISQEILDRVSSLNGPARYMAEQLIVFCRDETDISGVVSAIKGKYPEVAEYTPSAAPKEAGYFVPLRFVVSNGGEFASIDTTISKDWAGLINAVNTSWSDKENIITIHVRTFPKVKYNALDRIVVGAEEVSKFSFWDFFEYDGRDFLFGVYPAISGISVQDSNLVIGLKDSSLTDYQVTLFVRTKDGLIGEHKLTIHHAYVLVSYTLVFPDTLRVGDLVNPQLSRNVFWDGTYRFREDSTNLSLVTVVEPDRFDHAGLTSVSVTSGGQTYTETVLVRPRKERDFLRILGVNALPLKGRISVDVLSGIDSVVVSLNLNGYDVPKRAIAVFNDSAVAEFSVRFPENQNLNIFAEATDRFGNSDTLRTVIEVGDLTAPAVRIDASKTSVKDDKIFFGAVVNDAGGFSKSVNPFTVSAVDTVRKEEVFSRATAFVSNGGDTYVAWGDVDVRNTTGGLRILRLSFRVQDDGGNVAVKDTILVQYAYVAPIEPTNPPTPPTPSPISAPEIVVSPLSLNLTAQIGNTQTAQVAVSNSGNANLNLSNISITGAGLSVSPTSVVIGHSGQQILDITFAPAAAGVVNGVLTINSNDADEGIVNVAITATGTTAPVAKMSVSHAQIAFGDTIINRS